eukprot:COSAG02_NODE_3146_length_7287_cov_3.402615_3_plen_159_part_00
MFLPPDAEKVDAIVKAGMSGLPFDYVVDAIDSITPKVELIRAALKYRVPIVSSMVRPDTTQSSYRTRLKQKHRCSFGRVLGADSTRRRSSWWTSRSCTAIVEASRRQCIVQKQRPSTVISWHTFHAISTSSLGSTINLEPSCANVLQRTTGSRAASQS